METKAKTQCNVMVNAMGGFTADVLVSRSLAHFKEISTSNDPFYCPSCCAVHNQVEIHLLKSALASLTSKVNDLKTALRQIASQTMDPPNLDKDNHKSPKQPKEAQPLPIADPERSPKIAPSISNITMNQTKNLIW